MCGLNRKFFERESYIDFTGVIVTTDFLVYSPLLSLGGNNIRAEGALSIGEAIKVNHTLTSLS